MSQYIWEDTRNTFIFVEDLFLHESFKPVPVDYGNNHPHYNDGVVETTVLSDSDGNSHNFHHTYFNDGSNTHKVLVDSNNSIIFGLKVSIHNPNNPFEDLGTLSPTLNSSHSRKTFGNAFHVATKIAENKNLKELNFHGENRELPEKNKKGEPIRFNLGDFYDRMMSRDDSKENMKAVGWEYAGKNGTNHVLKKI